MMCTLAKGNTTNKYVQTKNDFNILNSELGPMVVPTISTPRLNNELLLLLPRLLPPRNL